ncbi:hypothetical protein HanXRQr2_Chr12g0561131 [Helianthus annuus]|uniref:Uncharacterized protein n=1 Tax=Helianthus annuus TaxID=4232 RepID=A0A9K3MXP2_HELAN|nr:hypothetical protein HanXRQr2_Chr12g0561131 [Helianthus annuus]KAJ0679636.1 hypothetical protein HanOQP8_Chr12g0461881 [Helianthus annuus]KAJ0864318.1 hypothetical protein HanPSC8_Chr12g0540531 [Helianthus annuus]
MHYSGANANSYLPSASAPHVSMYSTPPQSSSMINPLVSTGAYPMPPVYPPLAAPYPPQPYPPAQQPYGSHYSHGYAYPGGYTTLY